MGGVSKTQWPLYMKEAYRLLKPGDGWIQCGEFNPSFRCDDGSVPEDASVWKVLNLFANRDQFVKIIVSNFDRRRIHKGKGLDAPW
jgi:hypothetical protein